MTFAISNLRVEHYAEPLGIQTPSPRLSWTLVGTRDNWVQKGYEIVIKRETVEHYPFASSQSVLMEWPSSPLHSRQGVTVKVRVQGGDDQWTDWAEIYVEAGLLQRSDWIAVPVGTPRVDNDKAKRPFRVRRRFTLEEVAPARLYITALGLYEAYLNGKRIGVDVLTPGWTSYYARLPYQTYDVTHSLQPGENTLEAWVGEGWYAGVLGYHGGTRNIYGDRIALLAQIHIGEDVFATGDGWEWSYGAILSSEIYNGEVYDGAVLDEWQAVETFDLPAAELFSSQAPPVRVVDTIQPTQLLHTPSGKMIVDFGQNFAGVVRLLGDAPTKIVIRHAEVLEDGELGVRPLRYARATETVTGATKGYMPKFTFHGFRYAEISGWADLELTDVEGVVFQSSMERAGHFACSHPLINRLHENCIWSTMANTISVPTDCPQRDERLGWTGDICVYSPTMSYMFDTSGFLAEWLVDLEHDQRRLHGVVPIFSPDTGTDHSSPEAIWGDAAVLTPFDLYQANGDMAVLSRQYDSMKLWLEQGVRREGGLWAKDQEQLGDWLAPRAPPETPNMGPTDCHLVADAWLIHSTKTASKVARYLGKHEDADEFDMQVGAMTDAFYADYVTRSGRIFSDTQTALCLLLCYDIYPLPKNGASTDCTRYRKLFSKRLVELVKKANWQVDTGFAGTPIILQTLARIGHIDHAYRMLQSRNCPSWLACVLLGATTIWERWDSMLPDGSINPGEMTSFNHYALGSVASFMYEHVGGMSAMEAGWKRILVKPQPGGTVTSASTSHVTPYGKASVCWKVERGEMRVEVEIPPNTTAEVELPGLRESMGSGKRVFVVPFEMPRFPPAVFRPHFADVRANDWV